MEHHDRKVAVAALRHHVPHVHLVDGDVPPGTEVAQLALRLIGLLAADEEAPLCLQHQRRVGGLDVLEGLRRHVAGRPEDGRDGDTGQEGGPVRESLPSHVSSHSFISSNSVHQRNSGRPTAC